jgi:DNA-binding NarL/FixJ family response regulator
VRQIRVLLADPPTGVRGEIRTALAEQPDLIVVGEPSGEVDILLQAEEADVVILGMPGAELPNVAERLLDEYPRVVVLAVDLEIARALVYRLWPHLTEIDLLTPAGLVTAIRRAVADVAV